MVSILTKNQERIEACLYDDESNGSSNNGNGNGNKNVKIFEAIPLQDMNRNKLDKNNGNIQDEEVGGPSTSFNGNMDNGHFNGNRGTDNGNGNRSGDDRNTRRIGTLLDMYTQQYITYLAMFQSVWKAVVFGAVMTIDVQTDNNCRHYLCQTPIYTHDRAISYIASILCCGLSVVQFCIGTYICKNLYPMRRQEIKKPMRYFTLIVVVQILIFFICWETINILTFFKVLFISALIMEVAGVFLIFFHPESPYQTLETPVPVLEQGDMMEREKADDDDKAWGPGKVNDAFQV